MSIRSAFVPSTYSVERSPLILGTSNQKQRNIEVSVYEPSETSVRCRHRHFVHVSRALRRVAMAIGDTPVAIIICNAIISLAQTLHTLCDDDDP